MRTVQFIVRYTCGDNVTNTVHGERASATSSPRDAAAKLATKLFGDAAFRLEELGPSDAPGVTRWQATGEAFTAAVQARFVPLSDGINYRARALGSARAGG